MYRFGLDAHLVIPTIALAVAPFAYVTGKPPPFDPSPDLPLGTDDLGRGAPRDGPAALTVGALRPLRPAA